MSVFLSDLEAEGFAETSAKIINRCTRDGRTLWQQVAQMLGRPIDSVRAEHDPAYMGRANQREAPQAPQDGDDDLSLRSPHVRGPSLRTAVLARLSRGSASAETLAAYVGHPQGSVWNALTALGRDKLAEHDDRTPFTWSLTEAGKTHVASVAKMREMGRG